MSQLDINYHSRPSSTSSLYHQSLDNDSRDQEGLSTTPPKNASARRYATYELNWRDDHSDYNSIDDISEVNNNDVIDLSQNNDTSMNSAQAARWSLPKSPPPTTPLPPIPQDQQRRNQHKPTNSRRSKKVISINTTKRPEPRDNDSEPQSPFGGITVTTVKVVEIHSPTEKDENKSNQQNDSNLSAAKPVGIITSERKRKNRLSYLPPPPSAPQLPPPLPHNHKDKLRMNQDSKMLKQRISIINPQRKNSTKRKTVKPEMIIPKEMAFIDARLLAHKSLVRTPTMTMTTTTNRNRRVKRGNKKRMAPKNLEFGPTSNPTYSNDPTDMEADLPPIKHHIFPWIPDSQKPPQLIHASLVPLPHRVNGQINPTYKSNNTTNNVNNVPHPSSINPKRNLKIFSTNNNKLSRVNSQRRRASVISQNPNRASLVFRRQILEESLMMSFGMSLGNVGTGIHQLQPPVSPSKAPIRRKTKKVSNAKIEDREKRRERRRKEKLEKKLAEDAQNNTSNNDRTNIEKENGGDENPSKVLETNRIIESQVEKEIIYMGPQPPPRKQSQDATNLNDHSSPQKSKNNNSNSNNNTLPLFTSPPERRIELPELLTDEPPPFPAHLARSTSLFEHNEISKRKQPLYSPQIGLPPSSPLSSVSNNSRLMPSPLEENEFVDEEESQYDIINSDEAGSTQQLPPSNKSQKTGMGILGFFNKQATKDSTSPQISSPTQLPPQSPKKPVPLALSSSRATSSTSSSPQSPPLSPSRALRIPQQLLKSRRGAENVPSSPPAVSNPEKLRKMEQFEALIASTEPSNSNKKPITEKIKALTTAITTAATAATSSSSSSTITSNTSSEKRKKSIDGTPYETPYSSPRPSNESNLGQHKPGDEESEQRNRYSSNSSGSLANSSADSIHYKPEEMLVGKPGDDGVIRVTLTPAVCR